jgi:drug/metabolite transporter (DMT)-like permease
LGYALLLLATLAWSFVGVLVKSASTMVDSSIITFSRFFFGVIFLGIFLLIKDRRIRLRTGLKWIWLGAVGKSANYIFENFAITIGYAYGNILVQPVQTVTLLVVASLLFKERVTVRGWLAATLCVIGVIVIGWNGLPLYELMKGSGLTTLLFAMAGIGAAVHVLSQRLLVRTMDSGNMNFSVFFWSSLLVAIPLPIQSQGFTGTVTLWAWVALILLGVITGLSFYWFAEAMKRVPFAVVAIVGNSSVLFTILWSYLFYQEPISGYVIGGTFLFIVGFLLLNFPVPRLASNKETATDA